MSEDQAKLQGALVARYEKLRSQKVDPREDNALAITTDGRKLALDARLLSATAEDYAGSKVNAMVDNVEAIFKRTAAIRGTQMIFSDMGVHPTLWGYSVYDEIAQKLTSRGIPRSQIASIGEADSDAKKQSLFERVRNGLVRVLIGSTQKMGTGTNVQMRLVALHHLDAPWKPAEVEQREGRILRQGNENDEVSIYRYVTEGSFDSYMWQALETKARFIAQVMTGESGVRRAEDIGGQELSYAEVKAIASGNPAVLTLAEADAELQRLMVLAKNHADEQYLARRAKRELPQTIARLSRQLSDLETDQAALSAHAEDAIIIGARAFSRTDALDILAGRLKSLPERVRETTRIPLGRYQGLQFGVVLHGNGACDVFIEGATTRHTMLRDHRGPRALLNALERLSASYEDELASVRRDLGVAQGQLIDHEARIDRPFSHEQYVRELTDLRDRLKNALSEKPGEAGIEPPLATQELADRIRALKATHQTAEAVALPRVGKQSTAERPVTARIRERHELPEPGSGPSEKEEVPDVDNTVPSPALQLPDVVVAETAPLDPRERPAPRKLLVPDIRTKTYQARLF
jgi:hypothetical protein